MSLVRRLLFGALLLMGNGLFAAGRLGLHVPRAQVIRPEALRCLPVVPEPSVSVVGRDLAFSLAIPWPTTAAEMGDAGVYDGPGLFSLSRRADPVRLQAVSYFHVTTLSQGREYDFDLALYNYRARYYDPRMDRFLQTDPMGYHDSTNLYQGMNMNPLNYVDPSGEIIRIDPNQKEADKVLIYYNLLQLTSDIVEPPDPVTGVCKITEIPNNKVKKKYGTELMRRLNAKDYGVMIRQTFVGDGLGNYHHPIGSNNSEIFIDLHSSKKDRLRLTVGSDGKPVFQDTPVYITLGHELIHADRYRRKIARKFGIFRKLNYINEKGALTWQKTMAEEFETVGLYDWELEKIDERGLSLELEGIREDNITENQLRQENYIIEKINGKEVRVRINRRIKY